LAQEIVTVKAISRKLLRQDLDKRVPLLAGVLCIGLVAVHGILFVLYNGSRRLSDGDSKPSLALSKFQLRGDPRQYLFSSAAVNRPCDFDLKIGCPDQSDSSSAVQSLSKQQLPLVVRHLVERHTYGSAYDIVQVLLAEGHEQEAVTLMGNDVFDSDSEAVVYRSNFANRWYLLPAMSYVSHSREFDAISLFKQYLDIMRTPVKNGHWLSHPGLDSTDLPVLADIFCTDTDRLKRDECLMGLLHLASSQAATISEDAFHERKDKNLPDLGKVYEKTPSYFKSAPLQDYLSLWSWDGTSTEPTEGNLTADQTAAWNYAVAVRLLNTNGQHDDCLSRVARSQTLLTSVAADGDSFGYFKRAGEDRLAYVDRHRDDLCKVRDDGDATR
jgi:hypothetical protein